MFYVDGKWSRHCPNCNVLLSYKERLYCHRSAQSNAVCNSCSNKCKRQSSVEVKLKNSLAHIGKVLSRSTKRKLSVIAQQRMVNNRKGVPHSEHTKRLMRMRKCERLQMLGISPSIDEGATEWFSLLNADGCMYQMNVYFKDIGYFADGYDAVNHMWMEYDTPCHRTPSRRKKDNERQARIIEYFERIGNPLNQFVRVDATEPDSMGYRVVYKGQV